MTFERPESPGDVGLTSRLQRAAGAQFALYQPDEPAAGSFRATQIRAVLRLTPLTMNANVLNALLIADSFWSTAPRAFVVMWLALVMFATTLGGRSWFAMHARGKRQTASLRATRRAMIHAPFLPRSGRWHLWSCFRSRIRSSN